MIERPILIISLDTELAWGFIDSPQHPVLGLLNSDSKKGRGTVDFLLKRFDEYHIPATWAIVGHLFLDHCDREDGKPHKLMPRFKHDWYSADPASDIHRAPLYYGKDIVEKVISRRVRHEVGYHSFSHVSFSECSREVAEAEIKEGVKLASKLGVSLKSFVFPGNQIGHVDILKRHGFRIYRGPGLAGKNVNRGLLIRAANIAWSKITAPPVEPIWREGIWEIPSSAAFYDQRPFFITLLSRVKRGLNDAIRGGKIFHIYLHPWDLLTTKSLGECFEKFLVFASGQREKGTLDILTMGELASVLDQGRGEG